MQPLTPTTLEDWRLVLLTTWGTRGILLALAVGTLALGLTAWGYRRERRKSVLLTLLFTRLLAVAAVLTLMLQPAVQLRSVTRLPNHLAVLVDSSASMGIRAREGGPSRLTRAQALLKSSQAQLEKWRRRHLVDLYSFGQGLRAWKGGAATDKATRILEALTDLQRRTPRKDLAGVILISDGADNGSLGGQALPREARAFLKELSVPVHTVLMGADPLRDLALTELYVDHFAFVRNAVRVEADVLALGVKPQRLEVTLLEGAGGSVVASQAVNVTAGKTRYRVRLEFVPQKVGKRVYTVVLPTLTGEALIQNNRRSFVLKVIRDRVRVLQLVGRPSWDQRFLRRLLKRNPNVDLISFFILRTPSDITAVDSSELSLIPFPTDELFSEELGSFDLVILQNFNYGPYGIGGYLDHIRRYVDNGGGLAMLGGDLSFSSGGYAGTVLEPVLPVRLLPERGGPGRLTSESRFKPWVTREGRDHPILQLGASREETARIIAGLPSLEGVNLVARLSPGATALMTHPSLRLRGGGPMPVLATTESGKGRTLALTTDTSWHWAFLSAAAGSGRQAYDRFWRNAIRWLIRDPELKYLRVIAQQDRVNLGATVKAVVRAYNPDYSLATGLEVQYEILPPAPAKGGVAPRGTAAKGKTDSKGELELKFKPEAAGAYRLRATATLGGRLTTALEEVVLVEPAGPELREPAARPSLLKALAEVTGGQYLGQTSILPGDLKLQTPRVLQANWRKDLALWSRWWSLALAVLLLGLDWLLRRRYGYL